MAQANQYDFAADARYGKRHGSVQPGRRGQCDATSVARRAPLPRTRTQVLEDSNPAHSTHVTRLPKLIFGSSYSSGL